jgi:hypothetical protein
VLFQREWFITWTIISRWNGIISQEFQHAGRAWLRRLKGR